MDWLDEIEARAKAATEGPWHRRPTTLTASGVQLPHVSYNRITGPRGLRVGCIDIALGSDLDFIEASRSDVPRLIAEVRRLRNELHELVQEE